MQDLEPHRKHPLGPRICGCFLGGRFSPSSQRWQSLQGAGLSLLSHRQVLLDSCDLGILPLGVALLTSRKGHARSPTCHPTRGPVAAQLPGGGPESWPGLNPAGQSPDDVHAANGPKPSRPNSASLALCFIKGGPSLSRLLVKIRMSKKFRQGREKSRLSQGRSHWEDSRAARMNSKKALMPFLMLIT